MPCFASCRQGCRHSSVYWAATKHRLQSSANQNQAQCATVANMDTCFATSIGQYYRGLATSGEYQMPGPGQYARCSSTTLWITYGSVFATSVSVIRTALLCASRQHRVVCDGIPLQKSQTLNQNGSVYCSVGALVRNKLSREASCGQ